MTRVFLDDERPLPDSYDVKVTTAREAIALLESGTVTRISLDHDLGDDSSGTGYDVALAIERMAHEGTLPRIGLAVHSANPVGAERMKAALRNAKRFWMGRDTNGDS